MRLSLLFSLAMVTAASGCSGDKAPADAQPAAEPAKAAAVSGRRHDESSFAQPDQVRITDLALELALDFDRKQLAGTATYTLDWTDPKATQLVLDTRELTIQKVEGQADGAWAPLQFALADACCGAGLRSQPLAMPRAAAMEAVTISWRMRGTCRGKRRVYRRPGRAAVQAALPKVGRPPALPAQARDWGRCTRAVGSGPHAAPAISHGNPSARLRIRSPDTRCLTERDT